MKRRDFLEKVSELAKGSAAAITLNKLQIAAAAASILSINCSKENPAKVLIGEQNKEVGWSCTMKTWFCNAIAFICDHNFVCPFTCTAPTKFYCKPENEHTTGAFGGT